MTRKYTSVASRTWLNFWLDVILLVSFLGGVWSVTVLRFLFPPGTTAAGWRLWGMTYDHWFDLQFSMIALLALMVLVHVMLHWTWICGVITSRMLRHKDGQRRQLEEGEKTLWGVGVLIVLLGVLGTAYAAAALTIQSPENASKAESVSLSEPSAPRKTPDVGP